MKQSVRGSRVALAVVVGLACAFLAPPGAAELVYENTNIISFGALTAPGSVFGNQITLGGTDRYITQFTFQVQSVLNMNGPQDGDETLRLRFYANDGAMVWLPGGVQVAAPGTLLYESGAIGGFSNIMTPTNITVSDINVSVPQTFTWGIEVNFGLQHDPIPTSEAVVFQIAGPPSVGSTDSTWQWQSLNSGATWNTVSYGPQNSYYAQISAGTVQPLPEPPALLLLASGLVGLAGLAWRQRPK